VLARWGYKADELDLDRLLTKQTLNHPSDPGPLLFMLIVVIFRPLVLNIDVVQTGQDLRDVLIPGMEDNVLIQFDGSNVLMKFWTGVITDRSQQPDIVETEDSILAEEVPELGTDMLANEEKSIRLSKLSFL
jgi:hypothetical protein